LSIAAIIVAAGRGTRAGGVLPKQYQDLTGKPVLAHSILVLAQQPEITHSIVVIHPDDRDLFDKTVRPHLGAHQVQVVTGGRQRSDSVRSGLLAIDKVAIQKVLIHDGARPLASADICQSVIAALQESEGAAPALPIVEALWFGENDTVKNTIDRSALYRAQTPQGFDLQRLLAAYDNLKTSASDDVEVATRAGMSVRIVPGDEKNIKITHPQDFALAAGMLGQAMDVRIGTGFDVHAFKDGNSVVLCGVSIPHTRSLQGHSDADVAMHAITDAIFGAIAAGDIGRHFPPSDKKWEDADSRIFLEHAVDLVQQNNLRISNVDCTIICEQPKISPHADAMQANIADITGIAVQRISIKATTSERLGFTGRGEGIAAQASVSLVSL